MIGEYNKAWVALVMAILVVLEQSFGLHIAGMSEEFVTNLLVILTPLLVWLVPNRGY
jgi:hypothetical protein